MQESGQLKFIALPASREGAKTFQENSELGFGILFVDGHTDKQMLPHINYKGKKLVFIADLIPTVGHIPLPYIIGYDTRPLLTLAEKEVFLNKAVSEDYFLFFEHDAHNEICNLQLTEKGIRLNKTFAFNELFN